MRRAARSLLVFGVHLIGPGVALAVADEGVMVFGAADLAGAVWTAVEIRRERAPA